MLSSHIKFNKYTIIIISALVVIAVLTAFLIVTDQPQNEQSLIPISDTSMSVKPDVVVEQHKRELVQTIKGEDAFGKYVQDSKYALKDYTENFVDEPIKVEWRKKRTELSPTEMTALLKKLYSDYGKPEHCENLPQWRSDFEYCDGGEIKLAGTIESPASLVGEKLYYVLIPVYDEGIGSPPLIYLSLFSNKLKKFVFIKQNRDNYYGTWLVDAEGAVKMFAGFVNMDFPELQAPKSLSIPGDPSKLIRFPAFDEASAMLSLFDNETADDGEVIFSDPIYGPVFYLNHAYHITLPNDADVQYGLYPYFLKALAPTESEKVMFATEFDALVDWTDDRTEATDELYTPSMASRQGCGGRAFPTADRVNEETWFNESNLVAVGRTNMGELVYELKEAKKGDLYDQILESVGYATIVAEKNENGRLTTAGKMYEYDDLSQISKEAALSIFLSKHPIFFWKDKRGNWYAVHKARYQSMVECGKPVIYLYPEKEMDIRVEVAPNGGFTKTEPAYGSNGWLVRATPAGQIYNYTDKTNYPYLFWEGHAHGPETSKDGFIFAKNEVPSGMRSLLARTGLTAGEIEDFMEFWQEKLMVKPFVFVTFLPQREFDLMAPLQVTPTPDTIIRVFMDYTPLDKPTEVRPLVIRPQARRGFTVVEWGGTLGR